MLFHFSEILDRSRNFHSKFSKRFHFYLKNFSGFGGNKLLEYFIPQKTKRKRELILRANFRARIDLMRLTRLFSRSPRSRKGTTNYCRLFSRPYTMFASTFVHSHLASDHHPSGRARIIAQYSRHALYNSDKLVRGSSVSWRCVTNLVHLRIPPECSKIVVGERHSKKNSLQLISPVQTLINKS